MLEVLKQKFERYFFRTYQQGGLNIGGLLKSTLSSFFSSDRAILSEIVKDKIYLSNMSNANNSDKALVVSCVDIFELAYSNLLLEPNKENTRYHVLAMEDITATTGCFDQVVDTILLMSQYADAKQAIHIHCYAGVGRSAMITAIYTAWRYITNDPLIKTMIDSSLEHALDPEAEDYLTQLYQASCNFIQAKRLSCQFNDPRRLEVAISVLHTLISRAYSPKIEDENYDFLAALVQTTSFKKLQYDYFKSEACLDSLAKWSLREFFDNFLLNKDNWFEKLFSAAYSIDLSDSNPLFYVCKDSELQISLANVCETITELAERFPKAVYSQAVQNVLQSNRESVAALQQTISLQ